MVLEETMLNYALVVGIEIAIFVAIILLGVLLGYIIGAVIAAIIKRILAMREIKEWIAGSDILSLNFWNKLVSGIGTYAKVLFMGVVLNATWRALGMGMIGYHDIATITGTVQNILLGVGILVLFAVVGIMIGAVIYKIIKGFLDSIRVEERLAKHGLADALGGLKVTRVIAGIVMVYVFILALATGIDLIMFFLASGADAISLQIGEIVMQNQLVVMFHSLVTWYPQFVLGGLILIVGAIAGDFLEEQIKKSKTALATDGVAWGVKALTLFVAVVLALPKFTLDPAILEDSFKIIVAGVSIGLAISMGLGLKDSFANIGKKYEKRI